MTDLNDLKVARAVSLAIVVSVIGICLLSGYGCQAVTEADQAIKAKCIDAGGSWIYGTGCLRGVSR